MYLRRFAVFLSACCLGRDMSEISPPSGPGDFMCQCEFKDNNWVHNFNNILLHVHDLPTTLQDVQHPSTKWILRQRCDEDAAYFPNTDIILDVQDLLKLQQAALFAGGGGRLEAHHLCLPGQIAFCMLCTQQYLVRKSLSSAVKWLRKMTDLLSVAKHCIDADSPLPLRAKDLEAYLQRFNHGVPLPENPAFVPTLAWPIAAKVKTYVEAAEPLHECLPLKDPACFPRNSVNLFESCSECCHPSKGPRGEVECWVGPFTYERCCRPSPRPWKIEVVNSECRGQDEKNQALEKSLQAERKEVQALAKARNTLKEDLKICTDENEERRVNLTLREGDILALQNRLLQAEREIREFQENATLVASMPRLHKQIENLTQDLLVAKLHYGECSRERNIFELSLQKAADHNASMVEREHQVASFEARLNTKHKELDRLISNARNEQARSEMLHSLRETVFILVPWVVLAIFFVSRCCCRR